MASTAAPVRHTHPALVFFGRETRLAFLCVLFVEVVSFAAAYLPTLNGIVFGIIVLLVFVLSLKDLSLGVAVVLAELVIGSKGYLFWWEIGETRISLRLGLFLVVLAAWGIHALQGKGKEFFSTSLADRWGVRIRGVAWGAGVAYFRHLPLSAIFLDANGFLFLGLAPVLFAVCLQPKARTRLLRTITGALLASVVKTLTILFLFSHKLIGVTPEAYKWIRQTGVGEIADLGEYVRVFFQSHIYGLFFLFVTGGTLLSEYLRRKKSDRTETEGKRSKTATRQTIQKQHNKKDFLLSLLFVASLLMTLVSLSRSFWLALLITGVVAGAFLLFKERIGWRGAWVTALGLIGATLLSIGIFWATVKVPLPGVKGSGSVGLISERTTEPDSEAAAASRWQLLPQLAQAGLKHAIVGSGFGATVTYDTLDPRFRAAHGNGRITTFSFEWGYLDLWFKMGLPGLLAYGWFLSFIWRRGWKEAKEHTGWERGLQLGLLASLIALVATHATTPYLNHPLGIGWLLFVATFWESRTWKAFQEKRAAKRIQTLPEYPSVGVHIVTFNSGDVIKPCLTSVFAQDKKNRVVRVIDNTSTDTTMKCIQNNFPNVEITRSEKNLGFGPGHNRLLENVETDLVLLLNPDTELSPSYISQLVTALKADPSAAAAQGRILRLKNGEKTDVIDSEGLVLLPTLRVVEKRGGEHSDTEKNQTQATPIFGTTGAAVLIRTDVLKQLKAEQGEIFDETFFMYKEDVDLAYRLNHLSYKTLSVPTALAYHERWETGSSEHASAQELARLHQAKPAWMQAASWTNHWQTILKNVFLRTFVYTAPRFLAIEIVKAGYLLIRKPQVFLKAVLACFRNLPVTFRKRSRILQGTRQTFREQRQWITH